MKQLSLSLILLLYGLLIASCSKKDQQEGDCRTIAQVFEAFPDQGISALPFATIAYDDSARVRTVTGPGTEKRVYTYYKDSITVKTVYETGAVLRNTYFLDSEGRVVRSRSTDYAFQYDTEGRMIAFQRHNGKYGQASAYIPYTVRWEGGNLVEVSSPDPDAPVKRISFNYYPEPHQELMGFNSPLWEGRVLADWDMLYLVPGGYFGKSPGNLPKVVLYEFDEKGRVVTMADRWAFRYQCP